MSEQPSPFARLERLEHDILHLQAALAFHTCAHESLYSITREIAVAAGMNAPNILGVYQATLKKQTERRLAHIADTAPALASSLRAILQTHLDPQQWPTDKSE